MRCSPLRNPRRARRRGVAAMEAAFMAPFLVVLFMITVDFARAFSYQLVLNDCARNGAHRASNLRSYQETGWVSPYDDATSAALIEGSTLNPPLTSSQVTVTPGTGTDGNTNCTVSISYPFSTLISLPGLPNSFTLTAKTCVRVAP